MLPVVRVTVLVAVLGAMALEAEDVPRFAVRGQTLVLAALPNVLVREDVARFLESGLTTTFAVEVTVRDRTRLRVFGGCLLEIRYDLWEEVYLVTKLPQTGRRERLRLPSLPELTTFLSHLDTAVAEVGALAPRDPWTLRLRLSILPFSSAEQSDAQRWFSRSLERESRGEGAPGDEPASSSSLLNLLLATSIGREEAATFDWRLELSPEARQ